MTRRLFILLSVSLLFAAACNRGAQTNGNNAPAATPATGAAQATPDPNAPAKFLFADFPSVATTAKAGDYVLCPSREMIIKAAQSGGTNPSLIYYTSKMVTPGATESEVQGLYGGGAGTLPNAYLIAIPAGQKAQVGDIVLTWWQTGSGMQRAIVTDAANPSEPTVRYLDRMSDKEKLEKLKPNSFVKLNQPFQPGTSVAVKSASRPEHWQVLNVAGDKIFALGFAGKVKLLDKADCTPVPIRPQVKAGDKVKAAIYGSFTDATVISVDEKLGKVLVKTDGQDKEETIEFGKVMKS
jgi:hypothetical protein